MRALPRRGPLPHPVDAAGDALVEFGARHVDADLQGVVDGVVARKVGREGSAGDLDDFEGADDTAAVARQDRVGGLGVGDGQPGVQRAGAAQGELLLQTGPYLGIRTGEFEVVDGASDVQAGAADEDGPAVLREQRVDAGAREPLVLGDARRHRHVPDVQQVVGNTAALLGRQLGGADVHPPVELHRVCVDDLTAEALGEVDAEIGLSGRGGTHDGDDPRNGSCSTHRHSLANLGATSRTSYVTVRGRGRCLLRDSSRRFRGPVTPGDAMGRTGRRGISPTRAGYGDEMGVFAWLLGKERSDSKGSKSEGSESHGSEESTTAEAQTDGLKAGSEAEKRSEEGAEPVSEGAAEGLAGPEAVAVGAGADADVEPDTGSEAAPSSASATAATGAESAESGESAAEAVEIPKQQSAEKAADSEVGENARQ